MAGFLNTILRVPPALARFFSPRPALTPFLYPPPPPLLEKVPNYKSLQMDRFPQFPSPHSTETPREM